MKTATAETSTGKTRKPASGKKVAKTTARKTRGSSTAVKKKTAAKKAVKKKAAVKKPLARKVSKKSTGRKGVSSAQRQKAAVTTQPPTAETHRTATDSQSLSWMSARAASALKAVKASQAEKGQAVLARTRKQAAETPIDDDSLIRIAAEMPVDNDALVEFSTEQPLQEMPLEPGNAPLPAVATVSDETSPTTDTSSDSQVTPEPDRAVAEVAGATLPAEQKPALQTPPPPQQSAKRPVAFQPALAAGLLASALLLGYYFWPESDDSSAVVASQERTEIEATAAVDEPVDTQDSATNVATVPPAESTQDSAEINNGWTPSDSPDTPEPPSQPQTATIPAVAEPVPAPVEPAPVVATQVPQPAQPAVPAPPQRRTPAQGYYPQQPRPAYPQYYYR